jgi:hypothetical protein
MQLPPADARVSVEVSTAAEAATLEEGTDEHEASDADKQPKENEMMHGSTSEHKKCPSWRPMAGAALATFALLLAGPVQLCLSRPLDQTTFRSPEDASRALLAAVQKHDERAVTHILGAGTDLVTSGDSLQDTLDREQFLRKYQEMHRLVQGPGEVTALYIGAENWPFPIPLVSRDGVWRFDADGGANEIRFRRIGENEVTAIGICHALVAAETHPGADREADGLVKTVLANLQHGNTVAPFRGYRIRILSKSGGAFAAIAYPAVYRSSGVVTFIVNQDDVVYEKDLGRKTAAVAGAIKVYPSDPTWTPAESR